MNLLAAEPLIRWDWVGDHLAEIGSRLIEHLELTIIAVVIGFAISFPLAVLAHRRRWTYAPVTWAAGILYTIPSLSLFVILIPITGLSATTVAIGLVSYTLLILIRNTTAGLAGVPADVVDSAVGMGFSTRQVLWHVEVPLAMPVIMAGIRIATVSTIGLVTIGSLIGRGRRGAVHPRRLPHVVPDRDPPGCRARRRPCVRRGRRVAGGAAGDDAVGDRSARGGRVVSVLEWLLASEHWSGENGIPIRLLQHIEMCVVALAIAVLIAIPIGAVVGHTRRGAGVAVPVANLGRAIPSFAILVLVFILMLRWWPGLAFGFVPTVVALTLLAIPPILTNTYVGIRGVDADTVEAAKGMGMRGTQIFGRLELPLAAPVIVTGIRISAVQVVATATLAALIAGGGLGRYIVDGFQQGDRTMTIAGAVLVALLALATEGAFALTGRLSTPKTASRGATAEGPARNR